MVLAGNATTAVVSNLVSGATYFFAATAFDSVGNESEFSAEISHTMVVSNTAPSISGITNQTIAQDTSTAPLGFTVGDGQKAAESLHQRARAFHNEFQNQPWGPVRVIHCWPLLLVEEGLALHLGLTAIASAPSVIPGEDFAIEWVIDEAIAPDSQPDFRHPTGFTTLPLIGPINEFVNLKGIVTVPLPKLGVINHVIQHA